MSLSLGKKIFAEIPHTRILKERERERAVARVLPQGQFKEPSDVVRTVGIALSLEEISDNHISCLFLLRFRYEYIYPPKPLFILVPTYYSCGYIPVHGAPVFL